MNKDVLQLTAELVRIDSSNPGAFEQKISRYIENLLKDYPNVRLTREEVLPGRDNLMAEIPGEHSGPSLVYICHMDTVTLGDGWTIPPLSGEIIGNRLYGRGSCDMKSGLACALSAFQTIAELDQTLKYSLKLIATVDEEDFMRGVEQAIRSGWVQKEDWILDTEPTNGQIQVAHKGRTWFELDVLGTTAHASTPQEGADAIAAMAEIISYIRKQIQSCPSHQDLGVSTVTFGQIKGGYRPYVVPDKCTVSIDMRLVPPTDTKRAVGIVEDAISYGLSQIPGTRARYRITGDRPYIEKEEHSHLLSQLLTTCRQVTDADPAVSCFPGYTDTAVIAGTIGNHNCMSYGPGNLELAHKPDESVSCEDILRCQQVLTNLAHNMLLH